MPRVALLIASALLAFGCGGARAARKLEGRYDIGAPGEGWRAVRSGGADHAWNNRDLSATLYVDSNCAERYEDDALDGLLNSLVRGIARGAPLTETPGTLDGRDALTRTWDGALDGVAVRVAASVSKKDFCTYDIVYIAPPSKFDAGLAAMDAVASGFRSR